MYTIQKFPSRDILKKIWQLCLLQIQTLGGISDKTKKIKTTNIPFLDNDWSCISPGSGVGKWSLSNLGKNFKSISNAFKGTVDVIASDPPLVKGHVRLSTVPYKPLYC